MSVRIYRKSVWPRLAPSIPSAVCLAMLEACQSASVSNCTALLSQADHGLARPAALVWCSHLYEVLAKGFPSSLSEDSTDTVQTKKGKRCRPNSDFIICLVGDLLKFTL